MTPDAWHRLQQIAGDALELPAAARAAFLDKACCGDPDLRQQATQLIETSSEAEAFFDETFGSLAQGILAEEETEPREATMAPLVKIGQSIGRYLIDGVLGGGGMGEAFSARDTELDRSVALKFVKRSSLNDSSDSANRQVQEAKSASALNHPHIVTVYEVLPTEFGVAIVMELVKGEVLRTLCHEKQPLQRVLLIGEQMAEALAVAAAAGIVHSDIKPENVVLRPDGFIKILDFGLAQRLDTTTVSSSNLPAGSYRYMSPEQARGDRLTPASDVFSLGTVLFELASAELPFAGETPLQVMLAVNAGKPKALAEVDPKAPRELSDLLLMMMAKDPAARPAAKDVAETLHELRSKYSQPSVAISRKSRRWVVAAVAAISALAITAGFLWKSYSHFEQPPLSDAIPFARLAKETSISPDGSAVAYTCTDKGLGQICITSLSSRGNMERFGKAGADNDSARWSPDGKTLAYLTASGMERAAVILRNRSDGAERVLSTLSIPDGSYGSVMSWAPLTDQLVVATNFSPQDSFSLFLISIHTGKLQRLTTPPPTGRPFGDRSPAVSPDGKWLAFTRAQAEGLSDLYVLELNASSLPTGPPRKLETGRSWNVTPVWTADGKELVFSTGTLRQHRLARIAAFDRQTPSPLPLSMIGSASSPAIGRNKTGQPLLLFTSSLNITNLWEVTLGRNSNGAPHQLTSPSNSRDFQPSYAHDGRRFAFVSDRSGYEEVWVADANGAHPTPWTHMECGKVALPRWSPDNARLTFSAVCAGQGAVYSIAGPDREPVRLTEAGSLNENSRWSPDGRWIYFTSFRTGVSTTWVLPVNGAPAMPFSSRLTSNPQFSWDGKSLYFTRLTGAKLGLWRTPIDHPSEEELVLNEVGDYVIGRFGIYSVVPDDKGHSMIRFIEFATGKTSIVAAMPKPQYIFDVSPDGTKLIYARNHLSTEDVFQVDHFR